MLINICDDIELDINHFLPEELEWLELHFEMSKNKLICQSSSIEDQATDWLFHTLESATHGRPRYRETQDGYDV